jgi:large repetitive protein
VSPKGTLTTLYSFCSQANCTDGSGPGGLIQASDGNFYGVTGSGGANNAGTVFSLSMGLAPFVSFIQGSGIVGATAQILGQGFTGTTSVSFNGTPAVFKASSDTFLVARVPAGATTGPVTVTTSSGTLTSNVSFRVMPQVLSFSPPSGPVGTNVVITGAGLTGTTLVGFAGVTTTFTVNSDTQITATVPAGAQTGLIAVHTAGGNAHSATSLDVTP